jgi:hypothetical protein
VKFLKVLGLIVGTVGILTVASLQMVLAIWLVLCGLFLASRFSNRVVFFTEWSWGEFLATIGVALGVPYLILLATFSF